MSHQRDAVLEPSPSSDEDSLPLEPEDSLPSVVAIGTRAVRLLGRDALARSLPRELALASLGLERAASSPASIGARRCRWAERPAAA